MEKTKELSDYGHIEVKTWADDRESAFSFSFDDGYLCHYEHVRPILNQFGFKGTFYIILGYLTDNKRVNVPYGSWDHFIEMAKEGHEVASHSINHPHLTKLEIGTETKKGTITYELYESKRQIEEKIPDQKCITFAYPYAMYNSTIADLARKYYEAARSFGQLPNKSSLNEDEWMKLTCMGIQWKRKRETPADDLPKLDNFLDWIEKKSIAKKRWAIFVAHEVLPFSEIKNAKSWEPTSNEWFIALCEWLKEKSDKNEIWIETVANITKYIKERDNFSYKILHTSDTKIKIEINIPLDKKIFNFPLTADITIPKEWNSIDVLQGDRKVSLSAQTADDISFVRTKILPANRIVSLFRC